MARRRATEAPPLPEYRPPADPLVDMEISVVTPLFGGGPTASQFDPERPVSGQTVRGHLRFWWRACNAPVFDNPAEMFKAEADIWGGVGVNGESVPSKLDVRVVTLSPGKKELFRVAGGARRPTWRDDVPGYALFPFQESTNKQETPGRTGCRFQLTLSLSSRVPASKRDDLNKAVHASVWAWLTFGGVGARTRRGCGSLYSSHPEFQPPNDARRVSNWLWEQSKKYIQQGDRQGNQPTLSGGRYVVGGQAHGHHEAWCQAVDVMETLRQGANYGRKDRRQGKSLWPEADSIRDVLKLKSGKKPPIHPARPAYPRADLGLPIIFQQMGQTENVPTLAPTGSESSRMASPVILKPLAISAKRAVPIVLLLNAPPAWEGPTPGIDLTSRGPTHKIDKAQIDVQSKATKIEPLRRLGVNSAREAVLALAADRLPNPEGGSL